MPPIPIFTILRHITKPITWLILGVVGVVYGVTTMVNAHSAAADPVSGHLLHYVQYSRYGVSAHDIILQEQPSRHLHVDEGAFHPALPTPFFRDQPLTVYTDKGSDDVIGIRATDPFTGVTPLFSTAAYMDPQSQKTSQLLRGGLFGAGGLIVGLVGAWFMFGAALLGRRRQSRPVAAAAGTPAAAPGFTPAVLPAGAPAVASVVAPQVTPAVAAAVAPAAPVPSKLPGAAFLTAERVPLGSWATRQHEEEAPSWSPDADRYGPNGAAVARFLERVRGLREGEWIAILSAAAARVKEIESDRTGAAAQADRAARNAAQAAMRSSGREVAWTRVIADAKRAVRENGIRIASNGTAPVANGAAALSVRDLLEPEHFDALVHPVAGFIPPPETPAAGASDGDGKRHGDHPAPVGWGIRTSTFQQPED
jgi:hypothetical protein